MRRFRSGNHSCETLLKRCLANGDGPGKVHNAFISWIGDDKNSVQRALEAAQASDVRWAKGEEKSQVDGMPVAVKDIFCTQSNAWPTTAGSEMLAEYRSPFTATAVKRLEEAGAIVVGKANMDEFAMGSFGINSAFGPTTVKDDVRGEVVVAGGSSSGSAAAVALGCALGALGSDTGGSVRLPAAFCDVVGFKPSYGRISRHGQISYASSLDTPGVLAMDVEIAHDMFDVIAGFDEMDSTCIQEQWERGRDEQQLFEGVRVGIPEEFFVSELPPSTLETWEKAATYLEAQHGATVVPVSVPAIKDILPAYYVIATAEASSNLARYDGVQYGYRAPDVDGDLHEEYTATRSIGFGEEVKRRLLMGSFVLSSDAFDDFYVRACRIRAALRQQFAEVFKEVDVVVAPVSPTAAPTVELASRQSPVDSYLTDVMTVPASMAGLPAIAVPTGWQRQSIQLVSNYKQERILLHVANLLHRRLI